MPYIFSKESTRSLDFDNRCVTDLRNAPVANRKTKFRLAQSNMFAYTYQDFIPGFSDSVVYNTKPFHELVEQPLNNADEEGVMFFGSDYSIQSNARAKVTGDLFETLSAAVMWNIVSRWNRYMAENTWAPRSGYKKPAAKPALHRQVAVLNLPRNYDWVRLLVPEAVSKIAALRGELSNSQLLLPTSTPDLAIVTLPESAQHDQVWRTELPNLSRKSQDVLSSAHRSLEGLIEPGGIILAVAFKKSLRSDRLYQPLYEANIMQLLLEGHLGAPRVEFEVHTLEFLGTNAIKTYSAASLFSVLTQDADRHRAVRELYVPTNARELASRVLDFLDQGARRIDQAPVSQPLISLGLEPYLYLSSDFTDRLYRG